MHFMFRCMLIRPKKKYRFLQCVRGDASYINFNTKTPTTPIKFSHFFTTLYSPEILPKYIILLKYSIYHTYFYLTYFKLLYIPWSFLELIYILFSTPSFLASLLFYHPFFSFSKKRKVLTWVYFVLALVCSSNIDRSLGGTQQGIAAAIRL